MKHNGWVNILKVWNKNDIFMQTEIFKTKESAIKDGGNAITNSLSIVATVKIEWEDNQ